MAKIVMGILGGFSGRVGTVVGYHRHGEWFVRAYQPHIKDRKSDLQLAQRSRFKAMIQFASQATAVLRVGLRQQARAQALTEGNIFLKINHTHFPSTPTNPNNPANPGNPGEIAFAALRFSKGPLAAPQAPQYTVDERGVLTVRWSADGGRLADRIHLFAYCPATGRGLCLDAERGAGHLQALLPDNFLGHDLHLWAFAESKDGHVSRTIYLAESNDSQASRTTLLAENNGNQASRTTHMAESTHPTPPSPAEKQELNSSNFMKTKGCAPGFS